MVKCFVTGDNHFGKVFEGQLLDIKDKLVEARYEALKNMVDYANKEKCDLFFITGDLFEKTNIEYFDRNNKKKKGEVIERVIDILQEFNNAVIIIPGNHDYDDGKSSVWREFTRRCGEKILVLNENRVKNLGEINGNEVRVYPAYCHNEHSVENNLGWIKEENIETENIINIGMAHGTIDGLSQDDEGVYFLMEKDELMKIEVDVWFVGHAHGAYPGNISETVPIKGEKIFNAGTHQQIHIGNSSKGYGFIVEIEKQGKKATVSARKWRSGVISFENITITTKAASDNEFHDKLKTKVDELRNTYDLGKTVLRATMKGSVKSEEYENKETIYEDLTKDFLFKYNPDWYDFFEEISLDRINNEFAENTMVAQLLTEIMNDTDCDEEENKIKLNMAYQLAAQIRKENS